MQLFVFVRLHAGDGQESRVWEELTRIVGPSRQEPGCISMGVFRSIRDPRLFYIHSVWADETAFDAHATMPHTAHFIEAVDRLLDQPREVTRTERMDDPNIQTASGHTPQPDHRPVEGIVARKF